MCVCVRVLRVVARTSSKRTRDLVPYINWDTIALHLKPAMFFWKKKRKKWFVRSFGFIYIFQGLGWTHKRCTTDPLVRRRRSLLFYRQVFAFTLKNLLLTDLKSQRSPKRKFFHAKKKEARRKPFLVKSPHRSGVMQPRPWNTRTCITKYP